MEVGDDLLDGALAQGGEGRVRDRVVGDEGSRLGQGDPAGPVPGAVVHPEGVAVLSPSGRTEIRARGGGSLLYTASTSGIQGSAFSPVYSMAKFGVVGFVRSLAKRLAPERIRVNAICPGPIDTPMLRVFVARPDQQRTAGQDKEALVQLRGRQNPMGRTGRPEEIANAALFLISDEASFVSGAALPVDGAATA